MTNAEIVARNNAAAKRLARLEGLARFAGARASEATLSSVELKEVEARLLLIDYNLGLTEKEVIGLAAVFAKDSDFCKS
jgi:hypothetical protein